MNFAGPTTESLARGDQLTRGSVALCTPSLREPVHGSDGMFPLVLVGWGGAAARATLESSVRARQLKAAPRPCLRNKALAQAKPCHHANVAGLAPTGLPYTPPPGTVCSANGPNGQILTKAKA
jgi:hypothetical protein